MNCGGETIFEEVKDKEVSEERAKEIRKFFGIEEKGLWIPKEQELYYYLGTNGDISNTIHYKGDECDEWRIAAGNCYKTEQDAEKEKELKLATQRLKVEIARLNGGWSPNWDDKDEQKIVICLNCYSKTLDRQVRYVNKNAEDKMHLKSEKLAEQLMESHEKDLKIMLEIEV